MPRRFRASATAAALFLLMTGASSALAADGVVGSGTPASCTEVSFNAVFFNAQSSGGGTITFNCGAQPHVIVFGALKPVSANTEVRGGGRITLSGGKTTSLFQVFAAAALTLGDIILTDGLGTYGAIENLGRLTIRNSTLTNGVALVNGGAILNHGDLNLTNVVIEANNAVLGGGLYSDGGVTTIERSRFSYNVASEGGGAIATASGATVAIGASEFTGSQTPSGLPNRGYGGGIKSFGTVTIADSVLRDHSAELGGALAVHSGATTVLRSTFVHNNATVGNGIVQVGGTLTLREVSLTSNGYYFNGQVNQESKEGGAFSHYNGTARLTNVTISGNQAMTRGAIGNSGGFVDLVNVTISGNRTTTTGGVDDAAAIYHEGGTMFLTNVTVANNTAAKAQAGALHVGAGDAITLKNTVLANPGGKNCLAPVAGASFSFSSDGSCGFGGGYDNAILPFAPLGNNGGFTFTQLPLSGSAAIDNGTNAGCPISDQRGVVRPAGFACDAGAVETVLGVVAVLRIVEYFHAEFGHYFITYLTDEIAKLDTGQFEGWVRTGDGFNIYQAPGAGRGVVCRFFTLAFPPKSSHFYAPRGLGCEGTLQNADWQFEGDVFYLPLPMINGDCPNGHTPIYRLYNNGQGGAPNHRFTTNPEVRDQMLAAGYIAEGAGIGVGMCSPL